MYVLLTFVRKGKEKKQQNENEKSSVFIFKDHKCTLTASISAGLTLLFSSSSYPSSITPFVWDGGMLSVFTADIFLQRFAYLVCQIFMYNFPAKNKENINYKSIRKYELHYEEKIVILLSFNIQLSNRKFSLDVFFLQLVKLQHIFQHL